MIPAQGIVAGPQSAAIDRLGYDRPGRTTTGEAMSTIGDIEQPKATSAAEPFRVERLPEAVNAVSDPITVQGADGRIVFANLAAARALGVDSPAELLTDGSAISGRFELFDELGHPLGHDELPGRRALRTGLPQSLTIRHRERATGRERWSAVAAVPLLDADGRAEFAVNFAHDVSESKFLEEALRVSEARARLLADATRDLDESLDLDRTVATAMALAVPHLADWATLDLVLPDGTLNRVAVDVADPRMAEVADRLWAFTVEPGTGRAGDRAIAERRPVIVGPDIAGLEDDPARPELIETIQRLRTTSAMAVPLIARGSVEGVLFLAASDESRRYEASDSLYAMELARRIALAVGNARLYSAEQTARVAAEDAAERAERLLLDLESQGNRFETIIRNLPNGVVVAEAPSGRILIANEAVDRILGPSPTEWTALGDRAIEGHRPDGSRLAADDWPLARTIRTGEPVAEERLRVARADGTEVWLAARSAPITDADGRLTAGVLVFGDVTARHRQQVRTEFLAEAGATLASSLDYEETIAAVARSAVPSLADWSAVDILDDRGELHALALVHSDPNRVAQVEALRGRLESRGVPSLSARVVQTLRPEIVSLSPSSIEAALNELPADALDPDDSDVVRAFAGTSIVCVPLLATGRPVGTLTLAASGAVNHLSEDDLPFAQELASRAAAAIETARLFRDAARFRMILDAVRDGVTLIDPSTLRVVYANDAVLDQLGRARGEVVGGMTPEWTEGLTRDQLVDFVAPLLSGAEPSRSLDVVRIRPDGTRVPVEVSWQRVELPGVGPQLIAISRNIRERIETEQRLTQLARAEHSRAAELNAIIGAIGEGLIVLDAMGRVSLANPTARSIIQPLEEWTLDAILARFEDPDDIGRAAFTTPGETVTLRRTGPARQWVEIRSYAVESDSPSEREHIVVLRDVTALREREAVRDAFVGILSHELRTPVTTIYAGAKVLAREGGDLDAEARRGIFDDIHLEAERLHRLVEDVVALTRFGEGALEIGSEPVLLQRIIPTVVRSEEGRWPEGQFEVDLESGMPPVSGDPTYVEQVIRNLMANAVKYGGSRALIRVIARAEDDEVRVRVLDEGPGFPEAEAGRLFDLYYRSPSTARKASGSGIGLFVCARLLHAMGGRIWAANRPEGGAEFGFALRVMTEDR